MEEQPTEQTPNIETQTPVTPVAVKGASGTRNLLLAIGALIVGAVIIVGIFIVAYPSGQEETTTPVITSQTKQVTDITKTSDLNATSSELDSTNLDSYQSDLNQIGADAASF